MYRARMANPANKALTDALARFEDQVRAFAHETVHMILVREVERRLAALRTSIASPPRTPRRAAVAKVKSPRRARANAVSEPATAPQPTSAKRSWTRDAIVSELATWLMSGTAVEASFLMRHGPRGLVAAAKKTFGRFDAALNVASLQVSKMYPDGPPDRRNP